MPERNACDGYEAKLCELRERIEAIRRSIEVYQKSLLEIGEDLWPEARASADPATIKEPVDR